MEKKEAAVDEATGENGRDGRPARREFRLDPKREYADLTAFPSLPVDLARYLRKLVPGPEVDDLVGDVLLQAVQAWMRGGSHAKPRSLRALALEIGRDAAADWHRRRERRPPVQPLSGSECRQDPSDASHRLRATVERMLTEVRPLLTERQRVIIDQLFFAASCSALALRMSMNLSDLDAALPVIGKKIRRSRPEIYPPSDG